MNNKIREEIVNLTDIKYREFNIKLCPDIKREMIGVRIPILKKYAKDLIKEYSLEEIITYINDQDVIYAEEVMVKGYLIGYIKIDIKDKINLLKEYIKLVDGWQITDTVIPTFKLKQKDLKEYYDYILKYKNSNKEFELRFMIVSFLDYYINDEYIDDVIHILDNIDTHDMYYVQMGIAWCLCDICIKQKDKFNKYFINNNLDNFTHNKTIQKIIESFRVEDIEKDELRKLKRK